MASPLLEGRIRPIKPGQSMRTTFMHIGALLMGAAMTIAISAASAAEDEAGFKSLFNGKDLKGWAGRPQHWSVEAGAITGVTTKENPAPGNNSLIAKDGDQTLVVSDFEWPLGATAPVGPAILVNQVGKGTVLTFACSPDFATATVVNQGWFSIKRIRGPVFLRGCLSHLAGKYKSGH